MKTHYITWICIVLATVAALTAVSSGPAYARSVISSGGGISSSNNYRFQCAIGQAVYGQMSSTSFGFRGGFCQGGIPPGPGYLCGDADGSGEVDIDDVVALIGYIFAEGPAPDPIAAGDANCIGGLDIDDVVYLVTYIFNGGPEPCANCGGGPAVAKTYSGAAELFVYNISDESGPSASLAVESEAEIQGARLEFEIPSGVVVLDVESSVDGLDVYKKVDESHLRVGIIDTRGKVMIPSDKSLVVNISYVGDDPPILTDELLVGRGGGKLEVIARNIVDQPAVPRRFALNQSWPNPFNPTTNISFSLPEASSVRLDVYNILGQKIRTLVDDFLPAGEHKVVWDGKSDDGDASASGVYFYKMEAGDFVETKKMVIVK